jgi:hypothetical protein
MGKFYPHGFSLPKTDANPVILQIHAVFTVNSSFHVQFRTTRFSIRTVVLVTPACRLLI